MIALRRTLILVACSALAALLPIATHAADYTIAAPPAWVVPVQPGEATPAQLGDASDGEFYSLLDVQVRAAPEARVRYQRVVSRAINATGVDSIANIEIGFDPSYQQLVIHAVNVVRNGQVIAKLPTAKIQVLQREQELAARIFDGSKTASIFLEDIRVGDAVDYSYSTIGRNPVFDGIEFGGIDLQFGVPLARAHGSLLLPSSQRVALKRHNGAPEPTVSDHDGFRRYDWNLRNVPGITVESGAPTWYSPYARVEWSEFANWAAVARWALPLYTPPDDLGAALDAEIARIARTEPTPAGRLVAALRFVQAEIRYLGVETGRNSHAPNPPALVMSRRFGDCKDKTLMTVAMLNRLGITAHAALVDTETRRGIAEVLPNPAAFDHVIVNARIGDQTYWLDATRSAQDSALANLYQPDFDLALLIAPTTTALGSMKQPAGSITQRNIHVVFDARNDFTKPVAYSVVTVNAGSAAEDQRNSLSSTTLLGFQKTYLQFYANRYPGISVAKPLTFEDDKAGNRITSREMYSIASMASKPDKNGRRTVNIETPDVDGVLSDPEITIRKAPLALTYPMALRQTTEVNLPSDWPITPVNVTIADPAFVFKRTVSGGGRRLVIQDHYMTLTDEVAATDMPRYLANLARARAEVGYELSWTDADAAPATVDTLGLERINWAVALVALLSVALWTVLGYVAFRYDPPARTPADPELTGLGGWLMLLAIALIVGPFGIFATLVESLDATSIDNWLRLTTAAGANYHAAWAPLLLMEIVANAGFLVFSVLMVLLFFLRRSSFPRLAIAYLIATVGFQFIDQWFASLMPDVDASFETIAELVAAAVGGTLWTLYLWRSRRVRSTFVARLHPGLTIDRDPIHPPPLPRPSM